MLKRRSLPLFDPVVAEFARDEGMARALFNEDEFWKINAIRIARELPTDWVGLGEDLRVKIEAEIGQPHTPEVFGAMFGGWVRRGWFTALDLDKPKAVPSHASQKRRWQRTEKR